MMSILRKIGWAINDYFQGERWRAVVRFWKGFIFSMLSGVALTLSSGLPLSNIYWKELIGLSILTGLGLGTDKLIRAHKKP